MKISTGFVSPLQLTSTAQGLSGKLILPVNRSDSFYAQYKYVRGVPAINNQNSVPLNKLEVLNSMINSLQHIREISSRSFKEIPADQLTIPGDIDQSIKNYGQIIHETLGNQPPSFSQPVNSTASTGLAFNLSV